MNRISALLILSGLLALPASGATDSLCWNRDTERMDFYTSPPTRGDNNFFSFTVSGTANVTMIYPGTASMKQLPISLYELRESAVQGTQTLVAPLGQGCQNAYLNNLDYFMPTTAEPPAASAAYSGSYDNTKRYPEPETTYAGGGGIADNFEASSYTCSSSSCPTNSTGGKAWRYVLWPANDNGTKDGSNGSIDDACTAATTGAGYLPTDTQDCQLCVKTRGYWINYNLPQTDTSSNAMVAKGNWLNFFPPKWAILRLAYKRLVNGPLLNSLREGIGTQNDTVGFYRTQHMLPYYCNGVRSSTTCSGSTATGNPGLGLGAEGDGDDFLDPNVSGGAGALISGSGATYKVTAAGVCANDWLPNVAAWMFATSLGGAPG